MNLRTLFGIALWSIASITQATEFIAPYVPTVREDVELILDLAEVGPDDYVIDLGSGDGRFVIEAAKRGAIARGIELDPALIKLSETSATKAGVAGKVSFVQGDIFEADISAASVVTLYLFPEANIKLRPMLLSQLQPGARVVSNSFHMGDWEPDKKVQGRTSGGALLWLIPANVRGQWQMKIGPNEFTFRLGQEFQKVFGLNNAGAADLAVTSARLSGATFEFIGTSPENTYFFHGRVEGSEMKGVAHVRGKAPQPTIQWLARRLD